MQLPGRCPAHPGNVRVQIEKRFPLGSGREKSDEETNGHHPTTLTGFRCSLNRDGSIPAEASPPPYLRICLLPAQKPRIDLSRPKTRSSGLPPPPPPPPPTGLALPEEPDEPDDELEEPEEPWEPDEPDDPEEEPAAPPEEEAWLPLWLPLLCPEPLPPLWPWPLPVFPLLPELALWLPEPLPDCDPLVPP